MKTITNFIIFVLIIVNVSYSQWQQVYGSPYIYSIHSQESNIFAGTGYGLFVSSNNGSNWTQTSLNNNVLSLAVTGNYLIAGTSSNGIYRSSNNGANWLSTNITGQMIRTLAVSGNNVFAGFTNGVYISTNSGTNWQPISINFEVNALAVSANNIYGGTYSMGVFVTANNGTNWVQTSLKNRYIRSLSTSGNFVYAGPYAYGVYISSNNGTNWSQALAGKNVFTISSSGTLVYAGCDSGIYVSNDNGATWIQKNKGFGSYHSVGSTHIFNNYLFAGKEPLSGIGIFRRPLSEFSALTQVSVEIPSSFKLSQNYPNPFNPITNINFSIPKAGFVKLLVHDMKGKEIMVFLNQSLSAGSYEVD